MNPADGPNGVAIRELLITGRYGTADQVAATVAYLATEEAANITGANIATDGGITV